MNITQNRSYLDIADKLYGGVILSTAASEWMPSPGFIQRNTGLVI